MNKNIIITQLILTLIVTLTIGLAILRIEAKIGNTWSGYEYFDALADHCEKLIGSRYWGIQFPSATSTAGIVGCVPPAQQ